MPQYPSFPTQNPKTKALIPSSADAQGAQYNASRHGKYYLGAYNGTTARASNQSGVTTSVALATTYVGLCLSNPAGSAKNLVVQKVTAITNVAPSVVTSFGLITGFSAAGIVTHTTALTVRSAVVGASAAGYVGLVDSACTLVGTPVWEKWLSVNTVATNLIAINEDLDGEIVVPPGGYCAIGTLVASSASGFLGTISWDELPL